eukprot:CAMPEP_0170569868 /NCGR_PEP_ID=MMETSP0224-20130122/794_1 /TAXON_ID=285029 /ORGANISM="Togula jolla, Strain CCCM 725" /LENGTH=37 /DNA_ID= /DNA_START= /DNA_END= /DNA_ORIENTATION=
MAGCMMMSLTTLAKSPLKLAAVCPEPSNDARPSANGG